MVGRWSFLVGWPIFRGNMLIRSHFGSRHRLTLLDVSFFVRTPQSLLWLLQRVWPLHPSCGRQSRTALSSPPSVPPLGAGQASLANSICFLAGLQCRQKGSKRLPSRGHCDCHSLFWQSIVGRGRYSLLGQSWTRTWVSLLLPTQDHLSRSQLPCWRTFLKVLEHLGYFSNGSGSIRNLQLRLVCSRQRNGCILSFPTPGRRRDGNLFACRDAIPGRKPLRGEEGVWSDWKWLIYLIPYFLGGDFNWVFP